MEERVRPHLSMEDVSRSEDLDSLLEELLVFQQVKNAVEGEALLVRVERLRLEVVEDVVVGTSLQEVIKVLDLRDLEALDYLEGVGTATSIHDLVDGDVGGEMLEGAFDWEVERESLLLRGVRVQCHIDTLHVFGAEHGHRALRNLVEQAELLLLGGDISHDDFAVVVGVGQEFVVESRLALLVLALLLVSVDNHHVVLEVQVSLLDFFLEEDKVSTGLDVDSARSIGLKLVSFTRCEWQVHEGDGQESHTLVGGALGEAGGEECTTLGNRLEQPVGIVDPEL